jgi:hypothetical protein
MYCTSHARHETPGPAADFEVPLYPLSARSRHHSCLLSTVDYICISPVGSSTAIPHHLTKYTFLT